MPSQSQDTGFRLCGENRQRRRRIAFRSFSRISSARRGRSSRSGRARRGCSGPRAASQPAGRELDAPGAAPARAASTARRRRSSLRHLGADEPRADREHRDPVRLELPRERLAEPAERRLARRVRGRRRPREVRGAAARVDDPAAPALDHPRDHGPAAEVRAEDVHLEHVPPVVGVDRPGVVLARARCRRCSRAGRSGRARARPPRSSRSTSSRRETSASIASPPISCGRLVDLRARSRGDRDLAAGLRERARHRRADPAAAAGDECDRQLRRQRRSPPATPGSRPRRGRRDPAPSARARTARRTIFALRVFGSAATNRTRSGANALPELGADRGRRRRARARPSPRARARARRRSTPPRPSPRAGSPTAAASATAACADRGRLELGRPDPLAGDVERVVGAPVQEPVAVLVDRGPVAVHPDARGCGSSRCRGSARGRARSRASSRGTACGRRARRPRRARSCPRRRRRPSPSRAPGRRASTP